MPSPSWENLDDFFDLDSSGGFAVSAVIDIQGVGARTVNGIFDDPYLNADLGEYDTDTSAPRFTCKEIDVQGVGRGDYLTVNGTKYNIMTEPQSDGAGVAIIRMEPL